MITGAAVLLLAAATFATLVAWVSRALLCDPTCGADRSRYLTAQLVVAVAGLVFTAAMMLCTVRQWRRRGLTCLFLGLVCYAMWAAFLDRATHGSFLWT